MPVEIVGFAQALARCLHFTGVEPADLEKVLSDAAEPLELRFVEPSADEPLIQSGSEFTHLLFVQHGTIVPWQYPYSELAAPFLIGEHEFLTDAERWVASYSAITGATVVDIPVGVMELTLERLPSVRKRMHELVMRRLARFYWTSLATSGTPASRVAAALVSRLALEGNDYGTKRKIDILQKDLGRLTTMSRSAVADGLEALATAKAIHLGDEPWARFAGKVVVPDVKYLKDQAFAEVRDRAIRPLLAQPDEDDRPVSAMPATRSPRRSATPGDGKERPHTAVRPRNFRSDRVPSEGSTPLFDGYVAVDWSARQTRKTGKDSIWIAVHNGQELVELENPGTRHEAMNHIERLLREETEEGNRLLCGFDFPFGYPEGTAQKVTSQANWQALWERIAGLIRDEADNSNNRFETAAALNKAFHSEGPFWGNGLDRNIDGLPRRRPQNDPDGDLPPRLRYAESLVRKAQEVWKLNGAGSVGGQALTGIAMLERLRHRDDVDVRVWPFEMPVESRSHVLVEIYPSMIEPCPNHRVKDAGQVAAVAITIGELDRVGELEGFLRAPESMPDAVRREEGAIFGMHDLEGFRAAAQRVTPCC